MPFYTPLRYPGGKRKLANYFKLLAEENNLLGANYVEPFAGGAAVALSLLIDGFVQEAWINDIDPGIFAFWRCVKEAPEELCRRLRNVDISVTEWKRQRAVQDAQGAEWPDLAFSTLFLNRTNRSGIIRGGIVGGKEQKGELRLDARFNRVELVARIERIADRAGDIRVTCMDACELLRAIKETTERTFLFLDPPYYRERTQLYRDDYDASDHGALAAMIRSVRLPWVLTYNNCMEMRGLYRGMRIIAYDLNYAAALRYKGSEIMIFSRHLLPPNVSTPVLVPFTELRSGSRRSERK